MQMRLPDVRRESSVEDALPVLGVEGRERDRWNRLERRSRTDFADQPETVALWHLDVGYEDVDVVTLHEVEGVGGAACDEDVSAPSPNEGGDRVADDRFIIDEQHTHTVASLGHIGVYGPPTGANIERIPGATIPVTTNGTSVSPPPPAPRSARPGPVRAPRLDDLGGLADAPVVDSDDDRPADCKRTPECQCARCRAEADYLDALRHVQERMAKLNDKNVTEKK